MVSVQCVQCMDDFSIFALSNIDLGFLLCFFYTLASCFHYFIIFISFLLVCVVVMFIVFFNDFLTTCAIIFFSLTPHVHIFRFFVWHVFFSLLMQCAQYNERTNEKKGLIESRVKMNRWIVLHPQQSFSSRCTYIYFLLFPQDQISFFCHATIVVVVLFSVLRLCIEY